jgi:protein-tyrosine phosphatase
MSAVPISQAGAAARPWKLALLWLAVLGPLFFLSYGYANNHAAHLAHVPSIVYGWELKYIPFIPAFMLPYMSIDVFYGISLFVASTRKELNRHALRLLLAMVISVSCFMLFPLRVVYQRPEIGGFNGVLLHSLMSFDKPFNAAPSMHISLLVLLWAVYARHLTGFWRRALDVWFALIGFSVLFTWQHHFFDVPTGALVGFALLYLVPEEPHTWSWIRRTSPRAKRIASGYGVGALLCLLGALPGGTNLWLLWGTLALSMVALAYLGAGSSIFRKQPDGRHPLHVSMLMAPYLVIARFSHWRIARKLPERSSNVGDIVLRSRPKQVQPGECVLDLCAEMPGRQGVEYHYVSVPLLDLVAPTVEQLSTAVAAIARLQTFGKVHVNCALGVGRSAVVGAAWLLKSGQVKDIPAAMAQVKAQRPGVLFAGGTAERLEQWWQHEYETSTRN